MSVQGNHRITVATKIGSGFGLVLLLLLLVGGVAFVSIQGIGGKFGEFARISSNEVTAGRLQANMLTARIHALAFIFENDPKSREQFHERFEAASGFLDEAKGKTRNEEQKARLAKIEEALATYDQAFDQVGELQAKRDRIVTDVLDANGPAAEKALTTVMESAYRDRDAAAAFQAGMTLRDLLLARVYVTKFLDTNAEAAADRVRSELAALDEDFAKLESEIDNPTRHALVVEARAKCRTYAAGFADLVTAIEERNQVRDSVLDVAGASVASVAEELKLDIIGRQTGLAEGVSKARTAATITIVLGALVAVVCGIGISVFITRGIVGPVQALLGSFRVIATGDLTEKVRVTSHDEIGELGHGFNEFVARIRELIAEVAGAATEVAGAATEIAASSEEMAKGMEEQSTQTQQVASAVEEMAATVHEVSAKSAEAAATAGEAGEQARNGGRVVTGTVEGMNEIAMVVRESAATIEELGRRGEQIGAVINVINDIADQTNLLALNAAIEAARAGEHGRGFAVVADEVRKLADRTTTATDEIAESIQAIQDGTARAVAGMSRGTETVDHGVGQAQAAGSALSAIVASSDSVATMIQSIAAAAEEQSAAAEQISRAVDSISAVTRQATSGANQAATAATQLSARSEGLQSLVSRFKVSNG